MSERSHRLPRATVAVALAESGLRLRQASAERDKAIAERDAYKAALASLSSVLLELQEALLAGRVEMDDAARETVSIGLERVSEALEG